MQRDANFVTFNTLYECIVVSVSDGHPEGRDSTSVVTLQRVDGMGQMQFYNPRGRVQCVLKRNHDYTRS